MTKLYFWCIILTHKVKKNKSFPGGSMVERVAVEGVAWSEQVTKECSANCHREVHAGKLQLSRVTGIENPGEFREA